MSSPETPQRPADRSGETTQAMPAVNDIPSRSTGVHQATTYAVPGAGHGAVSGAGFGAGPGAGSGAGSGAGPGERGSAPAGSSGQWAQTAAPERPGAPEGGAPSAPRVRRARLLLTRVDPWSVMKLSFLLAIALGVVAVVAVVVLWSVLDGMGVFSSINRIVNQVVTTPGSTPFNLLDYIGFKRVVGATTLLGLVNVVLITALSTVAAFLYNLATSLVGGLHVTLSEDA